MNKPTALLSVVLGASLALAAGCSKDQPSPEAPAGGEEAGAPTAAAPAPKAEMAASDEAAPPAAEATPTLLEVGAKAPAFEAKAHDGSTVSLAELNGKAVVLYFYPKDETPGCTVQAQKFRDDNAEYDKRDAVVLGVSLDDMDSHKSFASNHDLPFKLLVDTEGELAGKYGVSTQGGYARRVTYVIGPDGTITHVFPSVDVREHSGKVLAALDSIN